MIRAVVRPAVLSDAEGIAGVHIASWKTTYSHIFPPEVFQGITLGMRTARWRRTLEDTAQRNNVFVAEIDDAIVGIIQVGSCRVSDVVFTHELYTLYTLAGVQGRGIGKSLVRAGVSHLINNGAVSMMLWVMAANQLGCTFYERLGGSVVSERIDPLYGIDVPEIAYGWPDLPVLLRSLES